MTTSGNTDASNANNRVEGASVKLKGTNLIPEVLVTLAHFMDRPADSSNEPCLGWKELSWRRSDRADLVHRMDLRPNAEGQA
jgi:hypothetical protein